MAPDVIRDQFILLTFISEEELAMANMCEGLLNRAITVSEVGGGQFLAEWCTGVFLRVGAHCQDYTQYPLFFSGFSLFIHLPGQPFFPLYHYSQLPMLIFTKSLSYLLI